MSEPRANPATTCTCGYDIPLHAYEHKDGCPSAGTYWEPTPWPPVDRYDPWNDLLVRTHEGTSTTLSVCNDCGAAVSDTERHDHWHRALGSGRNGDAR